MLTSSRSFVAGSLKNKLSVVVITFPILIVRSIVAGLRDGRTAASLWSPMIYIYVVREALLPLEERERSKCYIL